MMEPPLAGGGLGGHPEDGAAYATLLNTVESLQADLQQTITTCHGLREANAQLNREHEATKAELARQREKVSANRGELIRASKAKIEADRHTELLVSKWKVQLDERMDDELERLLRPIEQRLRHDLLDELRHLRLVVARRRGVAHLCRGAEAARLYRCGAFEALHRLCNLPQKHQPSRAAPQSAGPVV